MAVYKRGYQRYTGPLTGRWTRFMVLPRYAWRKLYEQRLVLLLTMAAFVWPLLCAGFVYLTNHVDLLQGLDPEFRAFIQVNGRFFSIFMYVQGACAVFLAALAGPGLIAPDLANNALPLYFSRPLTRWTYALARLTVLVGMLSIVTWVPGLILFGLQVGLAGGSWFRANWTLGAAMVAGFLIWLLVYRILYRRNGHVSPLHLVILAIGTASVTAVGEAILYFLTSGVDARLVLLAHFDVEMEVRPAWCVLAAGLAIAGAGFWRQKRAPQRPSSRRISRSAVSGAIQAQSGS